MLTQAQKIKYFVDSAFRYFEKPKCPFCLSQKQKLIDRKYLVTRLFQCEECKLLYRHPLEKISQNKSFYQNEYKEFDQITAILPTESELADLIQNNFKLGNKNAVRYVDLIHSVFSHPAELNIIDYGCSWGYITYQFEKAGFNVQGYEISKQRAKYGNLNLGVDIKTSENEIRPENDLFFSSHVIEHHPDLKGMISLAKKVLKKNGCFIAISPNGSKEYRGKNQPSFHHGWGKVHPNYINAEFYKTIFKDQSYYIGSSPFNLENIRSWKNTQFIDKADGEELIVIVKPNQNISEYPGAR